MNINNASIQLDYIKQMPQPQLQLLINKKYTNV